MRWLYDILGKTWTLPNTAMGFIYGSSGYVFGNLGYALGLRAIRPSCSFANNAIQFHDNPFTFARTAITIGNTISYGRSVHPDDFGAYADSCAQVGLHEKAHTYQYQLLGPFFLPFYFAAGGLSGPLGNCFELAAQRYAKGCGSWWPSRRSIVSR